jgi:hypothetical protein
MEALGSNGAECESGNGKNQETYCATQYPRCIAQLTGALLNIAANAGAGPSFGCSGWSYNGAGIDDWIEECQMTCCDYEKGSQLSDCIEALTAFNEDGDDVSFPPFDRPGIDDDGNNSGADGSSYGSASNSGVVIGVETGVPCVPGPEAAAALDPVPATPAETVVSDCTDDGTFKFKVKAKKKKKKSKKKKKKRALLRSDRVLAKNGKKKSKKYTCAKLASQKTATVAKFCKKASIADGCCETCSNNV